MSDEEEAFDLPSKSAGKREAKALRDLAVEIASMDDGDYKEIELPENLRAAMDDYRRFRSNGARRRQALYMGKLMRELDVDDMVDAVARVKHSDGASVYRHHAAERWRDALLAGDSSALTEFLDEAPGTDRQALRRAIATVAKAKDEATRRARYRKLYQLIYQSLPADPASDDSGGGATDGDLVDL
ncbi:MAG: DUF615 domain-containing protein [Pseudomonadaceae bacterium]|nr:DUF615 domain-containing protein [Pseudomonadaceae bacterium]